MSELPNEGFNTPCELAIVLEDLEHGDTFNIHEPCTLTFLEIYKKKNGKTAIIFEVSDVKYEEPKS